MYYIFQFSLKPKPQKLVPDFLTVSGTVIGDIVESFIVFFQEV